MSVPEGLDCGDALNPIRRRDTGVRVDVDLGENDVSSSALHLALEDGSERMARTAPVRPEVDDHGLLA
jgi:hypothetical protein